MIKPPIPSSEEARVAALRAYDVVDSEPEPQFDALVKLAAHIAGVPMALVTFIDTDRQWFKARYGIEGMETTRDESFCGHAVASGAPLIVPDSHEDERFHDNPFVTGSPHVRFYAGVPLRTPEGHVLGTLCTLDDKPRQLSSEQLAMLDLLAGQAVTLLEARRRNIALATFRKTLDRTHDAIMIFDATTLRCTYANEGAVRMLGYGLRDLLTMTPFDFVPDAESADVRAMFEQPTGDHAPPLVVETTIRDRADQAIPVEVVVQYVASETGSPGRWISVLRDISERKRVEQLQSEFVSTVSHELRTPLTSIRGSLGLVAAGITGELPAEAREYIDIALSNSDRLVRLINDILDVEKMQSGKMEFRIVSMPLRDLLTSVMAANEPAAIAANAKLALIGSVPDVEVAVDPDRFNQVVTNLVSNAAKYTPPGSTIDLEVSSQPGSVSIAVRDRGPGIPPEFAGRIFQRFAQADPSATRAKSGTGLGLAICKSIVERLGGMIHYENVADGGARFIVQLPALPLVQVASTGPRILVVENEVDVYREITRALSGRGFVVDVSPTLERARRLLATHTYAAVTLDLVLADGDGSELLPELSRNAIPVIVISGSNRELGRAAVFVADTLTKPVREERLVDAIRRVLDRKAATPRVLHVEDDPDLRRIVRRTLPAEWDVQGAETLLQARRLLAEQRFDAVVLDLVLPDGDGAELIPACGEARVIVFSAQDIGGDLARRVSSALVKTRSTAEDLRDVLLSLVAERHPR